MHRVGSFAVLHLMLVLAACGTGNMGHSDCAPGDERCASCTPEDLVGRDASRAVECYGGACATGRVPLEDGSTGLGISYCRSGTCQDCSTPVTFDTGQGTITAVRNAPAVVEVVVANELSRSVVVDVVLTDLTARGSPTPLLPSTTLSPGAEARVTAPALPPGTRVRLAFSVAASDGGPVPDRTKSTENVLITHFRTSARLTADGLDLRWAQTFTSP